MGQPDASFLEFRGIRRFSCGRCGSFTLGSWEGIVNHYIMEQIKWEKMQARIPTFTELDIAYNYAHELTPQHGPLVTLLTAEAATSKLQAQLSARECQCRLCDRASVKYVDHECSTKTHIQNVMLSFLLAPLVGAVLALASSDLAKTHAAPPTCIVPSNGNVNKSDTPAIISAFKTCGNGGRIVFSENKTYALNDLTIMTPCVGCHIELEGTLRLSDNITYWLKNTTDSTNITDTTYPNLVYYKFQDSVAYLVLKNWKHASFVSKTGKGLVDGMGQRWWDAAAGTQILLPGTLRRPVLFALDGAYNVTVDNIAMKNPANWFNWVTDTQYVTYTNIRLEALSTNKNSPANADGFDTYPTSNFVLKNAHIVSGDDCFAFKGNSTYITLENLYCQNSHGISVGSLAQYPGVLDIIEHVKVKNATFVGNGVSTSNNGARIKVWAGPVGSAIVNDVHYEDLVVQNVTNPIVVDSCYFSSAYCTS
ncbi:hypothetical protein FRC06_008597, partial [Ceratobasidium sp. 370]